MARRIDTGAAQPNGVGAVAVWLVDGARSAVASKDVPNEMCDRVLACGLPLWRVVVFVQTLYPHVLARRFLRRPAKGRRWRRRRRKIGHASHFALNPL